MEPNNCPKPDCGRPESTHRFSAGKRLSICGNGHSWDAQAIAEQRAKTKAAERQEVKINVGIDVGKAFKRIEREFRRSTGGPFIPSSGRNPFE